MGKSKVQISDHKNIIKLYLIDKLSQDKISQMYGCTKRLVRNILVQNNIPIRDHSHKKRIYTLNEHYFDEIDTPNKAYILGLLFADGCNYVKMHNVYIELQERDVEIIKKIRDELQSNHPIKFNGLNRKNPNWKNTYRLSITNKHMSETLSNKGMVQNKSLVLKYPTCISVELYPHFIRGYLDGDGHIEYGKNRSVTIASTKEFCESLQQICKSILNIKSSILNTANKESNTKIFQICGRVQIKKFLDYIYQDADLYIERKYYTYQLICNESK